MNLGDVVYLKSGSRPMTVTLATASAVTCSWDGGSATFPPEALTLVDPLPALEHARAKVAVQLAIDDPLPEAKEAVPA